MPNNKEELPWVHEKRFSFFSIILFSTNFSIEYKFIINNCNSKYYLKKQSHKIIKKISGEASLQGSEKALWRGSRHRFSLIQTDWIEFNQRDTAEVRSLSVRGLVAHHGCSLFPQEEREAQGWWTHRRGVCGCITVELGLWAAGYRGLTP